MLGCERLDIAIPHRTLVAGLELTAKAGEFVAVLGTNGAGKTLTLHTLAGLRACAGGSVRVDGRELAHWARRDLARRLSLLPQSAEDPFPTTALEAVLVGRHPHLGFWQWEGPDDLRIAREALAVVDLAAIEGRAVESLSGGERRRLAIAALLAQDPAICLLDEPTNHLDPHHQLDTLALFRARVDRGGLVVATLHDPTLAARFADRALLLFGNGEWLYGGTGEVLTAGNLSRLYRTEIHEIAWRNRRVFVS